MIYYTIRYDRETVSTFPSCILYNGFRLYKFSEANFKFLFKIMDFTNRHICLFIDLLLQ